MTGGSAIWRALSTDTISVDTPEPTATNSDKIEFDLDAAIPDNSGHVSRTEGDISTGVAENEAPFRSVNELQFTELETITLTIVGHIKGPDISKAEAKLKVWGMESQKTSIYTKGRFGLRLNDYPIFNVKPKSTNNVINTVVVARGYAIQNIKFTKSAEVKNRLDFVITLRLSGDLINDPHTNSTNGDIYDWSV